MIFIRKLIDDGHLITYDPVDKELIDGPDKSSLVLSPDEFLKEIQKSPPKKRPVEIIYDGSPEKSPIHYAEFIKPETNDNLKRFR